MNIKSRLLKQLDADIAAADTPVRQACFKVQRALLFARHGHMAQAREHLTALHQIAFHTPHSELGAWLLLAEGLMSYYTDFSVSAHEKVKRAYSISMLCGQKSLAALCSAWLAQLAYVRNQLNEMIYHAKECDQLAMVNNHAARYRLCTTMGLAHDLVNRCDLAQTWYKKARTHAAAEGDDAAVSALMYNMAQMRTTQARRNSLLNTPIIKSGLLQGADSVKNYDDVVGGSVNAHLTPILKAQILTVEGEYSKARAMFEQYLPQAMAAGWGSISSNLLSDLAWCYVNTGEPVLAMRQAEEACAELDQNADVDDRASTHSRLSQVYASLGDLQKSAEYEALAISEWAEFAKLQDAWVKSLQEAALHAK